MKLTTRVTVATGIALVGAALFGAAPIVMSSTAPATQVADDSDLGDVGKWVVGSTGDLTQWGIGSTGDLAQFGIGGTGDLTKFGIGSTGDAIQGGIRGIFGR